MVSATWQDSPFFKINNYCKYFVKVEDEYLEQGHEALFGDVLKLHERILFKCALNNSSFLSCPFAFGFGTRIA